ncbi:glutamate N-acetyltransferase [Marininema mesophilum]|uniref:Arginine biosynthesis bifunctional protein ArgJ n=1 Tax=Marininema mesophilum TaxID=1048340 RepID=A0A1H3AQT2_9BACL|nr:bifunctional glutamate N-acetyltransferase/amino-acid acetyltransferase ArgJ [Marininema mesophilum]SDX32046.1 glutamate N-acetyltransferase [Marininema mesophilum]
MVGKVPTITPTNRFDDASVKWPEGFKTCAINLGIKNGTLDFTVIQSVVPANAAAMFTQSRFCGAPLQVGKKHIANGRLQAFVINSKNANVATGQQGIKNSQRIVHEVANALDILPDDILPSSTGVIGIQLPIERMIKGIQGLRHQMSDGGFERAAEAIMTTDTRPKIRIAKVGGSTLVGIAKGSGMIEPNMATLLSYFVTDAKISQPVLHEMMKEAVNESFNMISVDTDTSTSDTVAIMANGLAGEVDIEDFRQALRSMSIELAKEIARDGEGATKLLEVVVDQAGSFKQAKKVAKSVVNSPLVKTAIFGRDPNWGRIAMAVGKCEDEDQIDPENIGIAFGDIPVYGGERELNLDLDKLQAYLLNEEVSIRISLGLGEEKATVWGCDLSYDYVRINAEYTT